MQANIQNWRKLSDIKMQDVIKEQEIVVNDIDILREREQLIQRWEDNLVEKENILKARENDIAHSEEILRDRMKILNLREKSLNEREKLISQREQWLQKHVERIALTESTMLNYESLLSDRERLSEKGIKMFFDKVFCMENVKEVCTEHELLKAERLCCQNEYKSLLTEREKLISAVTDTGSKGDAVETKEKVICDMSDHSSVLPEKSGICELPLNYGKETTFKENMDERVTFVNNEPCFSNSLKHVRLPLKGTQMDVNTEDVDKTENNTTMCNNRNTPVLLNLVEKEQKSEAPQVLPVKEGKIVSQELNSLISKYKLGDYPCHAFNSKGVKNSVSRDEDDLALPIRKNVDLKRHFSSSKTQDEIQEDDFHKFLIVNEESEINTSKPPQCFFASSPMTICSQKNPLYSISSSSQSDSVNEETNKSVEFVNNHMSVTEKTTSDKLDIPQDSSPLILVPKEGFEDKTKSGKNIEYFKDTKFMEFSTFPCHSKESDGKHINIKNGVVKVPTCDDTYKVKSSLKKMHVLRKVVFDVIMNGKFNDVVDIVDTLNLFVDCRDRNGNSPFLLAVKKGDVDLAKWFSERGEDTRVCNYDGQSALHIAVTTRNDKMLRFLLELGSDTGIADNNGCTPLKVATQRGYNDMIGIIKGFLSK